MSPVIQSVVATPAMAAEAPQDRPRKRKRATSADFDSELQVREEESEEEEDLDQVKRLKRMILRKDTKIKELEAKLAEMTEEISRSRHIVGS